MPQLTRCLNGHRGEVMYKLTCSTKVADGQKITTDTAEVKSRSASALRSFMGKATGVIRHTEGEPKEIEELINYANEAIIDESSNSIRRDMSLCVGCTRCVRACSDYQGMDILSLNPEGKAPLLLTTDGKPLDETDCISCGQCATFCPTGALTEVSHIPRIEEAEKQGKILILQTAPAPRVAFGEPFGMKPGEATPGQLVASAKAAGFKYVFDTNFTADVSTFPPLCKKPVARCRARSPEDSNVCWFVFCS